MFQYPRVAGFIEENGRMLYIFPVIRAMIASDWARTELRPIVERARPRQHQITAHVTEQLLTQAGL